MKESLMKKLDRICINKIKEIIEGIIVVEKIDYA